MAIQKTIGVVEALNERMALVEEDVRRHKGELAKAEASSSAKTVGGCLVVLGGLGLAAFALVPIAFGSPFFKVFGAGLFVLGLWIASRKNSEQTDTAQLRQRLDELRNQHALLVKEKRELVLGFEREIKEDTNQAVSENIEEALVANGTKACPFCAEMIKMQAIKCKHCGSMLDSPR